jgi:hypothetical protein
VSVLDQQRTGQSHIDQNWRRPASICISLAVLGALLGAAMWLQTAAPAKLSTKIFPTPVPPVPLRFGFYDLHGHSPDKDPVLLAMAGEKLDFLAIQNVPDNDVESAKSRSGFGGPDAHVIQRSLDPSITDGFPTSLDDCIISRHDIKQDQPLYDKKIVGVMAHAAVADRDFRLVVATVPPGPEASSMTQLVMMVATTGMQGRVLWPAVISISNSSPLTGDDLVQRETGLFDVSAVFWGLPISTDEMPPANHLLFSYGWSCKGGEVVRDSHDPLHRIGWIVSTAGAAAPATHPAGDGDD